MKSIVAIAFAAAFMCSPALAQDKGKSPTAPGQADTSPGKKKDAQGSAKAFAPGQQQDQPGDAKNLAPGAGQRKK